MAEQAFRRPGRSRGLIEIIREPYLTSLIVHKELRQRYRGSIFGMLWSYAKPAAQFIVLYLALGVFMSLNKEIDKYIVFMFSGIVLINYFSELFGNATRSVVGNSALVQKIYLPRELFPFSSLWVAIVHFLPQLLILVVGSIVMGWRPNLESLAAMVVGFLLITIFGLGVGLAAAALNVFYRDVENFVDLILMMATWLSPVIYDAHMVRDKALEFGAHWLWYIYQLNPITPAVELFHLAFWEPTLKDPSGVHLDGVWMWAGLAMLVSVFALVLGELIFRRLEYKFAQEL